MSSSQRQEDIKVEVKSSEKILCDYCKEDITDRVEIQMSNSFLLFAYEISDLKSEVEILTERIKNKEEQIHLLKELLLKK